jgi:hypothetical protein
VYVLHKLKFAATAIMLFAVHLSLFTIHGLTIPPACMLESLSASELIYYILSTVFDMSTVLTVYSSVKA